MKTLLKELWTSIVAIVVLGVICCGIYPVVVWGISQVAFSSQANGSLIQRNGEIVGSRLLAQGFSGPRYFHPRPSQAGTGYDTTSSGGSNLGPTSQKLMDSIKANVEAYRKENSLASDAIVPADAVTNSGSGLDPHISSANAKIQIARVAKERGLNEELVQNLIEKATEKPLLGFIGGDPGVNVLELNVALDDLAKKTTTATTAAK
jgi:potassium-transporting ATPase KdpC subunit